MGASNGNIKPKKNSLNLIKAVKSIYICKKILDILLEKKKLQLIIYSKKYQSKLEINISNYKEVSGRYIEGERNGKGKEYDIFTEKNYI